MLQNRMHYNPRLQNMNSAVHSLQNPINPFQAGIRIALAALAAKTGPGKTSINVTRVTATRKMTADSLFGEASFLTSDSSGLITLRSSSC